MNENPSNIFSTLTIAEGVADDYAERYASSAPWLVVGFRQRYAVVMSTYLSEHPEARVFYRTGE